jgi:hypothetical protein
MALFRIGHFFHPQKLINILKISDKEKKLSRYRPGQALGVPGG